MNGADYVKKYFPFILCVSTIISCQQKSAADYMSDIRKWRENRIVRLKSETGWLNLAGLYWLTEGMQSIGSDSSNNIIFPAGAPSDMGDIVLMDSIVKFKTDPGVITLLDNDTIEEIMLTDDHNGEPDVLKTGNYEWYIIKRGTKTGIRLRDLNSPLARELDSIPSYPVSESWKIKASFSPYSSPVTKNIPTVIGVDEIYTVSGILEFNISGRKLELLPFDSGDQLFLIFADETSGLTTYGAGRFLYCSSPDKNGMVEIDFNKAYNPPCAFTPFATCPLPPKENILPVAVEAGEKDPHIYEH